MSARNALDMPLAYWLSGVSTLRQMVYNLGRNWGVSVFYYYEELTNSEIWLAVKGYGGDQ
jgi:hypothetical protein